MKKLNQNIKETNLLISQATNNALKCSSGKAETFSHKTTKFWLANYCWENGLEFATEVVFKDNKRADFVIKSWKLAIEVLGTESISRFKNKSYPIPAIPISAGQNPSELMMMLDDLQAMNGDAWDFYLKRNLIEIQKQKMTLIKSYKEVTTWINAKN